MNDLDKITKWNQLHSFSDETRFVTQLVKKGLTYSEILIVLKVLDNTCNHCFDADESCECWNDE